MTESMPDVIASGSASTTSEPLRALSQEKHAYYKAGRLVRFKIGEIIVWLERRAVYA